MSPAAQSRSLGSNKTDLLQASRLTSVHDCGHLPVRYARIGADYYSRQALGGKLGELGSQLTGLTLLASDEQCAVVSDADGYPPLQVFPCRGGDGVQASSKGECQRNASDGFDDLLFHRAQCHLTRLTSDESIGSAVALLATIQNRSFCPEFNSCGAQLAIRT